MLTTTHSMLEYFREALDTAMERSRVRLTEPAQAYIVNLLDTFSRAENVFAGTEHGERPIFALMLQRAQEAAPAEAVRLYKHLGDSSLYLTGFFAEAVEREIVSRDYYVSVGESAYATVASLAPATRVGLPDLFRELADRFADLVELLEAMSLHAETTARERLSDERLLKLLDRYQRTGSREVLEALKSHGVVLRPGMGSDDDLVH